MTVLGLITAAIGCVVFLGAAVVYLRGSRDKGTIATLEASNRALSERVDVLKDELGAEKRSREHLATRVASLERENRHLIEQRPSAEAIELVRRLLLTHDGEIKVLLARHDRDVKNLLRDKP